MDAGIEVSWRPVESGDRGRLGGSDFRGRTPLGRSVFGTGVGSSVADVPEFAERYEASPDFQCDSLGFDAFGARSVSGVLRQYVRIRSPAERSVGDPAG